MLIELKKEYLATWLRRLASVDLGTEMNLIFKSVFLRVENGVLTLLRTNGKSFAVINIKESKGVFEAKDCKEPLEALVGSEKLYSITNKFSDDIVRIGTPTEKDFCIEQGRFKGDWKQYPKKNFPSEKAFSTISEISKIEPDEFKTVSTKAFVESVRMIKYVPDLPSPSVQPIILQRLDRYQGGRSMSRVGYG